MNKADLRVIGYIRVSSQYQVEDGTSLNRQREQIETFAKLKGYQNIRFIEDDGISGFKTTARKGYMELVDLCKKKKVDVVIVYDLSRLSRSAGETLLFINNIIDKNNIAFVSLNNDIDTTTPAGKAFLGITAVFNQLYRDEIAYKTKEALAHKRAKKEKTGGLTPFGYNVTLDGKLIENQKEQETINYITALRNAGNTLKGISVILNQEGRTTKTGKQFKAEQIRRILLKTKKNQEKILEVA